VDDRGWGGGSHINRTSTNAKYFCVSKTPRLDRIAHKRPKRKLYCVSDIYARYDQDVSEEGGGRVYLQQTKLDMGEGEFKKSVLGRTSLMDDPFVAQTHKL